MSTPLTHVEYSDHHVPLRDPNAGSMPGQIKGRPHRRWQGVFLDWYSANEDRFIIKLELLKYTKRAICLGFHGISRVITVSILLDEIMVCVEWQGFSWDIIKDLETFPEKVRGGYACRLCPEDNRPVFDSRHALRCAEVFEPFLAWVNDDLAYATAVSISGIPDEATWARLVPRAADGPLA